ncbi:MAG TPA: translation initiation factor IF-3 [Candidatus Paceibacterota bacterium]|nr:translation initiation factor IF-3 [Candidatus Paceibacterota bacterium]
MKIERVKINNDIRAIEVRVLSDELGNLGVMKTRDAIAKAMELGMDLVEISPDAHPPVAKIVDYGKFTYAQKKKQKDIKSKQNTASSEVKNVQIKVGTGEHDIAIKAKRASEWLEEGHRVKIELFLRGRIKAMGKEFLQERLQRIVNEISVEHKVIDGFKESPKGIVVTLERAIVKK